MVFDYDLDFKRITNILNWFKKAHKLKVKYENKKYKLINNISKYHRAGKLRQLGWAAAELRTLIERSQLPLYNNIVNFSQTTLLPTLTSYNDEATCGPARLLLSLCENILLDEFRKIRDLLERQLEFFETQNIESVEGLSGLLEQLDELVREENALLASIEHDTRILQKEAVHAKELLVNLGARTGGLVTNFRRLRTRRALKNLESNLRLQATLAATILVCITALTISGVPLGAALAIPWIYKVGCRWLPALAHGDVAEAIADFI